MNVETIKMHTWLGGDSLELPEDFVLPDYSGHSIANLLPGIARVLGATLPGMPPLDAEILDGWYGARRVVLLILDGVGYLRFKRFLEENPDSAWHEIISRGRMDVLTSVFPSTTTNALTTFWTGRAPAEHGIMGFFLYLKRFGVVLNTITFSPWFEHGRRNVMEPYGLVPEEFVDYPAIGTVLGAQGVPVDVLTFHAYLNSCLSRIHTRGVRQVDSYLALSDFAVRLRNLVEKTSGDRNLIMAYWAPVDSLSHEYGSSGEIWDAEMRLMGTALKEEFMDALSEEAGRETLFVVTADHGMVDVEPEKTVVISEHPELERLISMPISWEARAASIYPKCGKKKEVEEVLGQLGNFTFLDRKEIVEAGLLGARPPEKYEERIGDVVSLAEKGWALRWQRLPKPLIGMHGGLHQEEMLVPLVSLTLSEAQA